MVQLYGECALFMTSDELKTLGGRFRRQGIALSAFSHPAAWYCSSLLIGMANWCEFPANLANIDRTQEVISLIESTVNVNELTSLSSITFETLDIGEILSLQRQLEDFEQCLRQVVSRYVVD